MFGSNVTGNVDITQVDDTAQYTLGAEFPMGGDKIAKYYKYDNGAGNIVGIQGMVALLYGSGGTGDAPSYTVTCDYGSAASAQVFGGIVLADTITDGKYGWFQVSGINDVDFWGDGSIADRDFLVPDITGATHDGAWDTMADGEEEQVAGVALADDETDVMVELATVTANFGNSGTVTGGTSTATGTIKTIFKSGTTQKALLLTSVSGTFSASEVLTSTDVASGSATAGDYVYYRIKPGNARIRGWR